MDAVQVFNKIRDLPYHCPESLEEDDYRCWGKNRLLFEELSKGSFEVRFRVCDFLWSEQKIPKEITAIQKSGGLLEYTRLKLKNINK